MSIQKWIMLGLLFVAALSLKRQKTKEINQAADDIKYNMELEGYIDINYNIDFNRPVNHARMYSSNPLYSNQFGLAYAYLQTTFHDSDTKATLSFHQGGIVDLMYAGEKEWAKAVREASIMQQLNRHLDIEMGILPSIFGFETFINRDNLHATRAVFTDFAPDFEVGIRAHYRYSPHFKGIYQVTNGWQVIREN